jgi:hypothetical protein
MSKEQAIQYVEALGFEVNEFMGKYAVLRSDKSYFLPYMSEDSLIAYAETSKATDTWE